MNAQGIIRKISVGDVKNGMTYMLGQPMLGGRAVIVEITLDIDGSIDIGASKYDIIVNTNRGVSRIWKSIQGMPVVLEYELDPERDVEATE